MRVRNLHGDAKRDVHTYWLEKEQNLGEKILHRSTGFCYRLGLPKSFGILYLTKSYLIYEYFQESKSLISRLLFGEKRVDFDQELTILRSDMEMVRLIKLRQVKHWVNSELTHSELLKKVCEWKSKHLGLMKLNICLGIITGDTFLAFETPCDQKWLQILNELPKN